MGSENSYCGGTVWKSIWKPLPSGGQTGERVCRAQGVWKRCPGGDGTVFKREPGIGAEGRTPVAVAAIHPHVEKNLARAELHELGLGDAPHESR